MDSMDGKYFAELVADELNLDMPPQVQSMRTSVINTNVWGENTIYVEGSVLFGGQNISRSYVVKGFSFMQEGSRDVFEKEASLLKLLRGTIFPTLVDVYHALDSEGDLDNAGIVTKYLPNTVNLNRVYPGISQNARDQLELILSITEKVMKKSLIVSKVLSELRDYDLVVEDGAWVEVDSDVELTIKKEGIARTGFIDRRRRFDDFERGMDLFLKVPSLESRLAGWDTPLIPSVSIDDYPKQFEESLMTAGLSDPLERSRLVELYKKTVLPIIEPSKWGFIQGDAFPFNLGINLDDGEMVVYDLGDARCDFVMPDLMGYICFARDLCGLKRAEEIRLFNKAASALDVPTTEFSRPLLRLDKTVRILSIVQSLVTPPLGDGYDHQKKQSLCYVMNRHLEALGREVEFLPACLGGEMPVCDVKHLMSGTYNVLRQSSRLWPYHSLK